MSIGSAGCVNDATSRRLPVWVQVVQKADAETNCATIDSGGQVGRIIVAAKASLMIHYFSSASRNLFSHSLGHNLPCKASPKVVRLPPHGGPIRCKLVPKDGWYRKSLTFGMKPDSRARANRLPTFPLYRGRSTSSLMMS